MIKDIRVSAPAKINLHLAVGKARPDGFHSIASIFQAISLADSVSLSLGPWSGIRLEGDCGCPATSNTAYRAAEAFLSAAARAGLDPVPGLRIAIDKNIPMGAGLGGGSSDAASTLKALASLLPGLVDGPALSSMAASIGSDVPFFLGSACAAVTGRGERLSPLEPRDDWTLVLVDPGFPISTREAYARLDEARAAGIARAPSDGDIEAGLAEAAVAYRSAAPASWPFRNDFYDAMGPSTPSLGACRQALLEHGASFATMSGSGSAMFGVFDGHDQAVRAAAALSGTWTARVFFPLARLPDSI